MLECLSIFVSSVKGKYKKIGETEKAEKSHAKKIKQCVATHLQNRETKNLLISV